MINNKCRMTSINGSKSGLTNGRCYSILGHVCKSLHKGLGDTGVNYEFLRNRINSTCTKL